jgi:hypothetical protein
MSFPLKRRIAQAALVVAAGAVPMVAAGSASAAVDLTKAPDLGGLSHVDPASASHNVQSTAQDLGHEAAPVAGGAVEHGVPLVADTAGQAAGSAVPSLHRAVGDLTGHTTGAVGDASTLTQSSPNRSAVADAGPVDGLSSTAQQLPQSLPPVDGLPLGQVGKVVSGGPMTKSLPADDSPLGQGGLPTDQVQHVVNGLAGGSSANRLGEAPGLGSVAGGALPTGALGAVGPVGDVLGGLGGSQLG